MNSENRKEKSAVEGEITALSTVSRVSRRIAQLEARIRKIEYKFGQTTHWRLIFGLIALVSFVFIAIKPQWQIQILFLISISLFFWWVRKSAKLKGHKTNCNQLLDWYTIQSHRVQRNWPSLDRHASTSEVIMGKHAPLDLNIIGKYSLHRLIDQSWSEEGSQALADRFVVSATIGECVHAQKKVQQLEKLFGPIKRLKVKQQIPLSYTKIMSSLTIPTDTVSTLAVIFLLGLFALWITCYLTKISGSMTTITYGAFVALNFTLLSRTAKTFSQALGVESSLVDLERLFKRAHQLQVNQINFEYLKSFKNFEFQKQMKKIKFSLAFLSLASHPILLLVIHGFLPYQPFFAWLCQKAMTQISARLPIYFAELKELEVGLSLASLSLFDSTTFPVLIHGQFSAKGLSHPLISSQKSVGNNITFDQRTCIILTGSNMAGKSTFLRTLGLNQILTNMGGRVFAETATIAPRKVMTCLQVSDSLRDGTSYFYAELERMKWILDTVHQQDNNDETLVLVDEIFKGTNNLERLSGSQNVIMQLVKDNVLTVVSTHDLELSKLAEVQSKVRNAHFRDDIVNDELIFPFRLFEGPSPTTNALTLMRIRGLLRGNGV